MGTPPYRAPGDLLGLRKQHEEAPIPIESVPEPVRGLVRRGLAKKVEHRPKDAATFLYELEQVAGAGYGPGWEEEGRSALARRAALLLLLFPLAGLAAGGTGAAKTVIGWSNRSLNMLLAGAATLVLLIAGGVGWYFTQDTQTLPPVSLIETPSPSPSVSPSPSLSTSPSAEPSATASPSPSPSVSPSRPPSRPPSSPPPPASAVLSFSAPSPSNPNDFCWYGPATDASCYTYPDGPIHAKARITVKTTTGAAMTVTLRLVQVYYKGQEYEITGPNTQPPIVITRTIPAGGTTRTLDVTDIDLSLFWRNDCYGTVYTPKIKLTVTANIPGPASTPVYINDAACTIG